MTTAREALWRPLSRVLYPGLLVGAVLATALIQRATEQPILLVGSGVLAGVGALLWILELTFPYLASWRPTGRRLLLDVTHTLMSSTVTQIVKAGLLLTIATLVHPEVGLGLWPSDWPVVAQLALAIPLADLGIYLGHRVMHVTDVGWRIHAIHHSPEKLHFWAAACSHPFNVVVKILAESGPLLLLGIHPDVYALWLIFMTVNGLLQHANIDLKPGLLNGLLATNLVHRIHHDRKLELSNSNFGNTTMIWDRLFGTYHAPEVPTTEVGIAGCDIPERYGMQLLAPFLLQRFESDAGEPQ